MKHTDEETILRRSQDGPEMYVDARKLISKRMNKIVEAYAGFLTNAETYAGIQRDLVASLEDVEGMNLKEAIEVVCDTTNNTPATIASGEINVRFIPKNEIGKAVIGSEDE